MSGGLGPLQMVSEPDIGQCASEEAEPQRGVDTRWCASKDARPRREVEREVPHRLEKGTSASEDPKKMNCEIPCWLRRKTKHYL